MDQQTTLIVIAGMALVGLFLMRFMFRLLKWVVLAGIIFAAYVFLTK